MLVRHWWVTHHGCWTAPCLSQTDFRHLCCRRGFPPETGPHWSGGPCSQTDPRLALPPAHSPTPLRSGENMAAHQVSFYMYVTLGKSVCSMHIRKSKCFTYKTVRNQIQRTIRTICHAIHWPTRENQWSFADNSENRRFQNLISYSDGVPTDWNRLRVLLRNTPLFSYSLEWQKKFKGNVEEVKPATLLTQSWI